MKKEIKTLTLAYLIFLALLMVTGYFDGVLNTILYIIAFVLPLFATLYVLRIGDRKTLFLPLRLKREHLGPTFALLFPTLLITGALSLLASFAIFSLTGKSVTVDVGDNLFTALLLHALLPALLEEMLFRYLPLLIMGKRAPRTAVIFSAVCFSLVHHSFFSIPYAFVAGLVFMTLDIVAHSVLPSVIIHFVNNALSVVLMILFPQENYTVWCFVILGILSLFSLAYVLYGKKYFAEGLKRALAAGEEFEFSYEPILIAVPTLFMAVKSITLKKAIHFMSIATKIIV